MAAKKKSKGGKFILLLLLIVVVIVGYKIINKPASEPQQPEENEEKYSFFTPFHSSYSTEWTEESNVAQETSTEITEAGIREKYTKILGDGKDEVTLMVYMCGTDLESEYSMASYDLSEMAAANLGDNVNIIIYTGGCSKWHINGISTKYNQIYQLKDGGLSCLNSNAGSSTMLTPENLAGFIEYCAENFEANRMGLILWDHGGGTISGYGYDEKYPNTDSLTLDKIDEALTMADVKFDFIGFDACLMATAETGLMLSEHADYMIASEESEPGIGWYYTNWLTKLGENSSMATTTIGKNIADDFVSKCASEAYGQAATLSVTDLAQLQYVLPEKLSAFAKAATDLINDGQYKTISTARGSSRAFGESSGVDMVDLADLASHIDTEEAKALKEAVLSCVKYNNTSRDMSNSYGLSIYFPYESTYYVSTVLGIYDSIDMDDNYGECIKSFASYQGSGQFASGGQHSAYDSFDSYDAGSYYSQQSSAEDIYSFFEQFLGGAYSDNSNYSDYYGGGSYGGYGGSYGGYGYGSESDWFSDYMGYGYGSGFSGHGYGRSVAQYIADNHFDADLTWKDGKIALTKEQWQLVTDLQLNVFVDDGEGYIDLGKDNIYEISDNGELLAQKDLTWIVASSDGENWQVVPYYYTSSLKDGDELISYGKIPVLLNGNKANLLIQIDDEAIKVIGAVNTYDETKVIAKNTIQLSEGDEIQFICDYYKYDGTFQDSYILGDKLIVGAKGVLLGDGDISTYKTLANYEIQDIYRQSYWTTEM